MRPIHSFVSIVLLALSAAAGCGQRAIIGGDAGHGCRANESFCNGVCSDPQSDRLNCGACGTACSSGAVCVSGTCQTSCPQGETVCQGVCVSLANDNGNCGACGTACGAGEVCSMRACSLTCAPTLTTCGGGGMDGGVARYCADTRTDRANCGACGTTCPAGNICQNGACVISCPVGQVPCASASDGGAPVCFDTTIDRYNCGACGTACPAGNICQNGACVISCPAGQVPCGSGTDGGAPICFDLNNNRNNCGTCGNACPPGQVCSGGTCGLTCQGGLTDCSGTCRDLTTDVNNCHLCGASCPSGARCASGSCTCPGTTPVVCNNACVDAATDNANCGACGMACIAGQMCSMGLCAATCATGLSVCGTGATAYCANFQTDNANCGACGVTCTAGQMCRMGACVPTCSAAQSLCGTGAAAYCANFQTDNANCGACGTACTLAQSCVNGACVGICTAAQTLCGTGMAAYCANLQTDNANCGACAQACVAGQMCSMGACGTTCAAPLVPCGTPAACTNRSSDPSNCGACGMVCAAAPNETAVCAAGRCSQVCQPNFADCNRLVTDGCETSITTIMNCGACGTVCPPAANATATCTMGTCGIACSPGFADCDRNPANGCETALNTLSNCASCGDACGVGHVCASGACSCPAPTTACGAACANLQSDPANCGSCGRACGPGNVCMAGACVCNPLFPDVCPSGSGTVCTSLRSDPNNCGTCGTVCTGGTNCRGGMCVMPCPVASSVPVLISGAMVGCSTASSNTGRKVAMDASGFVYAAMNCAGRVFAVSSADGGLTWSAPVNVGIMGASEVAIQGGPSGVAYLAATTNSTSVSLVRTFDGGNTWGTVTALAGPGGNDSSQLSIATLGDNLYVAANYGGSIRVFRNANRGSGAFLTADSAQSTVFFDVLADSTNGNIWSVSDDPSFHLRLSTNGGATFAPEVSPQPVGTAFYSDWAIGGPFITVAGSSPDTFYRIRTSNPQMVASVPGLQTGTQSQQRAIASDSVGNSYIVSSNGASVYIQRVLVTDATASASRLVAAGSNPGVNVSSACTTDAVVVFTNATGGVMASVQAY